jgi:NADPH:quinone reductase-like Zn-dependent oxidoreductase
MKSYRVKSFSGIDGLQQVVEQTPSDPVARQVLVKIHASSINFRDLVALKGFMQEVPPGMAPNHIALCDGAGEIVKVGSDVTRAKPGDRVALTYHRDWMGGPTPSTLNTLGRGSGLNEGTLTEFSLVDESEVVHLPAHLSYEEGATLPCAGVTAWYALHGATPLYSGEDVLVMGTGGVSIFALQLAKTCGARVIATTTSPGKMETLRKLGADVVIDASAGSGWSEQVLAATGGRGVDLTVEVGGGATWKDSVKSTRYNGRMSMVGALSGSTDGLSGLFMMRGLNLHPTRVGSRAHFEQLNRAIAANGLRPVIDRVFEFAAAKEAFKYFESGTGTRIGKVVIRHV